MYPYSITLIITKLKNQTIKGVKNEKEKSSKERTFS